MNKECQGGPICGMCMISDRGAQHLCTLETTPETLIPPSANIGVYLAVNDLIYIWGDSCLHLRPFFMPILVEFYQFYPCRLYLLCDG